MHGRALLLTGLIVAGSGSAEAAGSGNPTHDRLLSLPPREQAQIIGKNVGHDCVGMAAFPMGVVNTAKLKGLAYWSIRCKDGRTFAIQIAPNAETFVIDCQTLKANGKECFKKF
jgi:hypothetical protein